MRVVAVWVVVVGLVTWGVVVVDRTNADRAAEIERRVVTCGSTDPYIPRATHRSFAD